MRPRESLVSIVRRLRLESDRGAPFRFETGLRDEEFERIEAAIGFRFPRDLRALLSEALPVSSGRNGFPDWRSATSDGLREMVQQPMEEILWSVRVNGSWMSQWGERPPNLANALQLVRAEVAKAPSLIPVYSHRYLAAGPAREGNPVFSIVGFDVVYYGNDLVNYLDNEFLRAPGTPLFFTDAPRHIDLWSDLAA